MHTTFSLLRAVLLSLVACSNCAAQEELPTGLFGEWSLELETEEPAWLKIYEEHGQPRVRCRVYIGSSGPFEIEEIQNGRVRFPIKGMKSSDGSGRIAQVVEVELRQSKLFGTLIRTSSEGSIEKVSLTGERVPAASGKAPDLSQVVFGAPIPLFNGRDLTGWRPHEGDKINGWSAQNGTLVNTTTKTDFSPTGAYANLRTEAEFADFRLNIEFLVEKQRNSGIYLRGMYEAQVVDRDSRMQGIQGVGAIFGQIEPAKNAGKVGGQWQQYVLTLVDRHITVELNGEKVIDNRLLDGPTAGAIRTNASLPGPIYLQGDHTSVKFRNISLSPVKQASRLKPLFASKRLRERLESVGLTEAQWISFECLSQDLSRRVQRLRDEVGIAPELIRKRDTVMRQLKEQGVESEAMWAKLQEATGFSESQVQAFEETRRHNKTFRSTVLGLLSPKQKKQFKESLARD